MVSRRLCPGQERRRPEHSRRDRSVFLRRASGWQRRARPFLSGRLLKRSRWAGPCVISGPGVARCARQWASSDGTQPDAAAASGAAASLQRHGRILVSCSKAAYFYGLLLTVGAQSLLPAGERSRLCIGLVEGIFKPPRSFGLAEGWADSYPLAFCATAVWRRACYVVHWCSWQRGR